MLLCRCDRPIPENERRKIALFCNVRPSAVIAALDVDTIYAVPLSYHAEGMDREVLRHFNLPFEAEPDLGRWHKIVNVVRAPEGEVRRARVGNRRFVVRLVHVPDRRLDICVAFRGRV